ncbi:MAG TPA: FtsH protease activity modulator HflK [Candidatus Binatia bacterium]|nr:FtsH protease activity modulator HflK [Candidatus Binatia bacterium]
MAWNDPPGGGRDPWNQGGRGAPDLDHMLQRLKGRFKGKGPGKGPAGLSSGGTGLLVSSVALLWILTGFYSVDEQERGVVLRFGAFVAVADPGPRWHLPWPVDEVEKVNVTQLRQATERADLLTRDQNLVDVELKVQYRVSSAEKYLFGVEDPDGTLRQAARSAMGEVVGARSLEALLGQARTEAARLVQQRLQALLDQYGTGLVISEVNMSAQAPEAVKQAFAEADRAGEDQKRLRNEALAYANDRVPKARGAAARQVAQAQGDRSQRIARAQGDTLRFTQLLGEYRKAPRVTRDRLYLETMSEVLSRATTVIVDGGPGAPVVQLPPEAFRRTPVASDTGDDETAAPAPRASAPAREREGR